MALLQRERIINFKLLIVVFVAVGMTKSTAPENITYTCNDNGVLSLQNIVDFTHFKILTGPSNQGPMCSPNDGALTTCKNIADKKHVVVVFSEDNNDFVGHGSTVYDLICKDKPSVVSKQLTAFKVKSHGTNTVTEIVNIPHSFNLVLKKNSIVVTTSTEIDIGDELKLQMTGSPSGVVISPLNCTASVPGNNSPKTTIWHYDETGQPADTCITDQVSIISTKKWVKIDNSHHDLQVSIYAFRFSSSAEVVIECAANVCSNDQNAGCTKDCVTPNTNKRRRRDAANDENIQKHMRSSSVSFAISSKEFNANSSSGRILGSMKFVIFSLTLVCVYTT